MNLKILYRRTEVNFEINDGMLPVSISKGGLVLEVMSDYSYRVFELNSTKLLLTGKLEPKIYEYC